MTMDLSSETKEVIKECAVDLAVTYVTPLITRIDFG